LQLVEQVALLNFGTFDEQSFFEIPADSGNERYPPYGLDATDELVAFCDLLSRDAHDPHGRRRTRRRLRAYVDRSQRDVGRQHETEDAKFVNDRTSLAACEVSNSSFNVSTKAPIGEARSIDPRQGGRPSSVGQRGFDKNHRPR